MKLGVCVPNYGETSSLESIRKIADEAARDGYDSVWCTDHILMSKNSGTPYERIFETITTLAYLSAATSKVRLGISSLVLPMRNPVVVAKQLATIDLLSNGRVTLATGVGWNEREFANLGPNFHDRGRRMDASLRLIRDLWSSKNFFESKTLGIRLQDGVFEPRPIQKSLPIWIAGSSPAAMRRAAKLGDAWHPNVQPLDRFAKSVTEFRGISPKAGEKDICVRIGLNVKADKAEYVSSLGEKRMMLTSNRSENERTMEQLTSLGVSYAVLVPSPDGTVPVPDQIAGIQMIARDFL